ncbi:MAG: hypothetical protein LBK57_07455 [Clostridiales Family XIII bacterium]|nr:hypothetical protein [Clostridiales Family XIII bacterium]
MRRRLSKRSKDATANLGVLDNFSGYAYLSENSESAVYAFVRADDLRELVKKKEHWYWASSS